MSHVPVLLNETLDSLDPKPGEFIIDGTTNGGGHLAAIIGRMKEGVILAVDWDKDILDRAKERTVVPEGLKVHFVNSNYADIPEIIEREGLPKADGLLLDLGFSTEQLENKKGFSYKAEIDEPLDMRYDRTGSNPTAAEIVNSLREEELAEIIFRYGEERFSRYIAKGIVEARKEERIITVKHLVEVIKKSVPKFFKKGEMDVVARTFQAIRIFTNHEFENIERILEALPKFMNRGGRVAIISFHSLEDRIIKNKFIEMEKDGIGELIHKKPIAPREEEIQENPKSRSAKLRTIIIK